MENNFKARIYTRLFSNQQQMLSEPSHKLLIYDILQTHRNLKGEILFFSNQQEQSTSTI